jgi:glycosyltransferase involved in cell wall biosynthesis
MHCGIATFTRDLRSGLSEAESPASVSVLAVGEMRSGQRFSREVLLRIDKEDIAAYRRAGQALNRAGFDVVCVQHEFGIFGGPEGRAIVDLLEEVRCPTVVTLHTVEREFEPRYRRALMEVVAASDHLVVPSESGRRLLTGVYGIDERRVTVIHHGVPDVPFTGTEQAKRALGFSDRQVLLTFGLLSSNKGIENVLDALPEVVEEHPDVLYVVLGATHPEIKRRFGEEYRESLQIRAEDLGLSKHVEFHDRYVDQPELVEYLSACDVYVTPYHSRQQIVSGTLAYAVGMGKAVISTPYPYARELLADRRGALVGYDDAPGIAKALRSWLDDPEERERVRRRAYAFGRQMTWPEVGRRHLETFDRLCAAGPGPAPVDTVPLPNLAHLARMTDDTGTLQHALHDIPNRRFGYTTDDVSRALIVGVRTYARRQDPEALRLITTSLAFLAYAQREDGRFRNEMAYDRRFLDELGSEDTLGQTLWGLGVACADARDEGIRNVAWRLFSTALPNVMGLSYPRAIAYAACGLAAALRARPGDRPVRGALCSATGALLDLYDRSRGDDWRWFGFDLTYANAKLPHALLLAAQVVDKGRMRDVGLETLDFLIEQTFVSGRFEFVGNEGWHYRGGPRADFGQQPIEAAYTAEACLLAAELTGDDHYRGLAQAALAWFTGRNRLGVTLYDPATGTCQDGIDRTGISANAGAESTIVCLMALLAAEEAGLTASQ